MVATMRIRGLPELQRKLSPSLVAQPSRNFLTRGSMIVLSRAKQKVPKDRSRLLGTIAKEVDSALVPRYARVGTNVEYGPYVELGTRPHWPPKGALQPWAQRHGFGAGKKGDYRVRAIIAKKGTKKHPFLEPALTESRGDIQALLPVMAAEIEAKAAGRG